MEYKIFLRSYYHKLPRLLLFSFLAISIAFCGCEVKDKEPEKPKEYEAVSFYPSGKPKSQNILVEVKGKKEVWGFQELHENGKIKMGGPITPEGKRTGKWESFYEDGKPWSIAEYANGVEIGEKKTWYPNGKLRYQGAMKEGKPTGRWTFWDESGKETYKEY